MRRRSGNYRNYREADPTTSEICQRVREVQESRARREAERSEPLDRVRDLLLLNGPQSVRGLTELGGSKSQVVSALQSLVESGEVERGGNHHNPIYAVPGESDRVADLPSSESILAKMASC